MKRILFYLLCLFVGACNNNTTNNNTADMPAEEKKLRDELALHPDSFLLKENLVQYFRDNNNYSQAITETEKALQKDSSNERLWYMKATLLFENEDTTKAITAWEKLVQINARPDYIQTLGFLYAINKEPMALAMSNLLLTAPNTKAEGLFIQGLYYSKIGEKENAIALFTHCLKLNYSYLMAYREKAIAEYDLAQYLEALKTLELALAVKKTYDEAYYWMGRCYEKLGKNKEAAENYQMALQFAPGGDYPEAKDALGKMGVVQ